MSLYKSIKMSQYHNEYATNYLIEKFMPLISKLTFKLKYDEAKTDLVIAFIELIDNIKLYNFEENNEGALVKYIQSSLNRRSIDLYRKNVLNNIQHLELNETTISDCPMDSILDKILVDSILHISTLTEKQKNILVERYIKNNSDSEIAYDLNISRQAVYENRKKAINTIRTFLEIIS